MNKAGTVTAAGHSIDEVTAPWIIKLSEDDRRVAEEFLANVASAHPSLLVRRSAMVALRDIASPLLRSIALQVIALEAQN